MSSLARRFSVYCSIETAPFALWNVQRQFHENHVSPSTWLIMLRLAFKPSVLIPCLLCRWFFICSGVMSSLSHVSQRHLFTGVTSPFVSFFIFVFGTPLMRTLDGFSITRLGLAPRLGWQFPPFPVLHQSGQYDSGRYSSLRHRASDRSTRLLRYMAAGL